MRRFLFLAVLAASLLPFNGPAQAQATADQLNKLSLEALTAPPAGGGGGGYGRRSYHPAYHARYHRPYRGRSYARLSYAHARRYHYVPPYRVALRYARGHRAVYRAHVVYRGRPVVHRSVRVRPAVYHRPRHR
jgi:hypothetical protein